MVEPVFNIEDSMVMYSFTSRESALDEHVIAGPILTEVMLDRGSKWPYNGRT